MKTLSYGETVRIKGLRRPYQLVLDQKGYMASRGLPLTDETAKEELRRGGRSVGFIAIDGVQKAVDHTLRLGEPGWDVFDVVEELPGCRFEIPFDAEAAFAGNRNDLYEHAEEMWHKPEHG